MATLTTSLTSASQQLKEYNSLFTFGRMLPLSAAVPGLTGSRCPGMGYPWFLFDPSSAGFNLSKTLYLSSAVRQLTSNQQGPGVYPPTVIPNSLHDVHGKCIPWSGYTLPASASYINNFYVKAFTSSEISNALTFFVVPPISGAPVPVLIWFPNNTDRFNTATYTGGQDCDPINHIHVTPRAVEAAALVQMWQLSGGLVRIRTAVPSITSDNKWEYHNFSTNHPAVTSFVWIESLLGYIATLNLNSYQKIAISTKVQQPSATMYDIRTAINNRNIPTTNFCQQLSTVLNVAGVLSASLANPTQGANNRNLTYSLSGLYRVNNYPKVADIRTFYDFISGTKYHYDNSINYSGIILYNKSNESSASLIQGVPVINYRGKTGSWSAQDKYFAKREIYGLLNNVRRYVSYWRTLTAIPLSARAMFNYNPAQNTVVNTYAPTVRTWLQNTDYTIYHPQLDTWTIYVSAPGLQRYARTMGSNLTAGLLALVTNSAPLPSAIDFKWPNTYNALTALVNTQFDAPMFYKAEKTYTRFGNYLPYAGVRTRTTTTRVLSAFGFVPLSSLTITTTPAFVTDYTITNFLTGGSNALNNIVLSGTITFNASANIPLRQLSATLTNLKDYYSLEPNFIWNGPIAVKTIIPLSAAILSSINLFSIASQLDLNSTVQLSGDRFITSSSLPARVYATGLISANTLYTHPAYRSNLRLSYTDWPTEERINNILNSQYQNVYFGKPWTKTINNIHSVMEVARFEVPYTPKINLATREILVNANIHQLGYPRIDENGNTLPIRAHQQNLQSNIPFVAKPIITWTTQTPISAAASVDSDKYRPIKWRTQGILSTPRKTTYAFSTQRRKRVLGY